MIFYSIIGKGGNPVIHQKPSKAYRSTPKSASCMMVTFQLLDDGVYLYMRPVIHPVIQNHHKKNKSRSQSGSIQLLNSGTTGVTLGEGAIFLPCAYSINLPLIQLHFSPGLQ